MTTIQNTCCKATIDHLCIDLIVAHCQNVWQQVNTQPRGLITDVGSRTLKMNTSMTYPPQTPMSFQAFVDSQCTDSTISRLFEWYPRYQLMYSCSYMTCSFVHYLVPELQKIGITSVRSSSNNVILLHDLVVYELFLIPTPKSKQHTIEFMYPNLPAVKTQTLTIEAPCAHNFLVCSSTGAVIDLCVAQFTGVLEQKHFYNSIDEFISSNFTIGSVLGCQQSTSCQINQRLELDRALSIRLKKNVFHPENYAKRVAKNVQHGWTNICRECNGVDLHAKLKQCSRCKTVFYCGRFCQKRHWKREHKSVCTSITIKV